MNRILPTTSLALGVQTGPAQPVIADAGRYDIHADRGPPGRIAGGELVATGNVETAPAATGLEARFARNATEAPPRAATHSPTRRSSSVANRN